MDGVCILSFQYSQIAQSKKYRLFPGDKIIVETLNYRAETVLVVGEQGSNVSGNKRNIKAYTL